MPDKIISNIQQYAAMQRKAYAHLAHDNPEDQVVGHYQYHENVPYETQLLFEYGDVRKPIFQNFHERKAFDICCGEGRMIRRMRQIFGAVDGADISPEMVALAKERTPGSNIHLTNGYSAGDAPDRHYDFCYCTISLQHICAFTTRDLILRDLCRILKDDGKMTLQYLFSRDFPLLASPIPGHPPAISLEGNLDVQFKPMRVDRHHATWFEDKFDATSTNSGCDVVIGPNEIPAIVEYFRRYFRKVDMWFYDISVGRGDPRLLPETHPNSHISDNYWGTGFIFIHLAEKIV